MSLLKDFSPKRTRSGSGPRKQGHSEARFNPVQEIKPKQENEDISNLIDQYSYHLEENKVQEKSVAQKEQLLKRSKGPGISFGFFELSNMCEEHLMIALWGPFEKDFKKIYDFEKEVINKRMEIISEYKKEVTFDFFRDYLFYYKGEIIIPEEYKILTGFMREYLKIEKVIILYKTGEMLLEDTSYCNFWFPERLNKFYSGSFVELSHTEILLDKLCLKCIFNWNCPFARIQQMTN